MKTLVFLEQEKNKFREDLISRIQCGEKFRENLITRILEKIREIPEKFSARKFLPLK